MEALILSTGLLFTAYLIYVRIKLGHYPISISASFYDFKNLFLIMLSVVSTSLLIYGYNTTEGLPLLAIGALGFFGVGSFACFRFKKVGIFHYIAAISGFGFSIVSLWLDYNHLGLFAWTIIIGLITFLSVKKESRTWWVEIVLAYCLLICLLL